ncbi:peptidase inhibitor family I36 protein [Streptomyces sp. MMBL 11-3]|uniref:peptidase inhibitor family I36 protein n=1 Tax=Streptomyces sp. MMBL 11-3 TaxID=3382639 RepID=UPI0039B3756F
MRTIKRALSGLLLAAVLIPVAATTAQAGGTEPTWSNRNPGNCDPGYLCVYKGVDYKLDDVGIAKFKRDNPIWSDTDNRYIAHEDSSWFNNGFPGSYSSVEVFADNGYGGNSFCLDTGWGNTWDRVANDQGEANRWRNGPC